MRKFGIILLFAGASAWAYENAGLSDLMTPSELTAGQAEFILDHRFYGVLDSTFFDNLLGMRGGASVGIGFRVSSGKGFDFAVSHLFQSHESGLDVGYSFDVPSLPARAKIDVRYFSFRPVVWEETRKSAFQFGLALQSKPIAERVSPVLNVFYDGYKTPNDDRGHWRIAGGCDLKIVGKFHLFGEYYPETESGYLKDVFVFGFKMLTWGHQFYFMLGNDAAIGNRWLAQGAMSNDLHFGFAIHRLIEL